ncbi:polyubiquitin protein [Spatholobus suberectus]|nr:polyubiquitin protein [Spatholobus suberectus]
MYLLHKITIVHALNNVDANARSCRLKSIPCFKDLCTIYGHVMEGKGDTAPEGSSNSGENGAIEPCLSKDVYEDADELLHDVRADEDCGISTVHPDARQYMTRPLPYYKDLCVICDPNFDEKESLLPQDKHQNAVDFKTECPSTSQSGQSPITPNSNEEQFSGVNELAHIGQKQRRQSEKCSDSTSPKKSRNDEQGMAVALHEMAAVVSTVSAKKTDNSMSIENVIEAVQALPDMDDDLVLDACDFLEDERKAKTFLALDAKLRKKWLIRKLRTQV